MASDKQTREGMGLMLTTKNKAMLGVLIVVSGIVVWQVMGLFGGGGGEQVKVTPVSVSKTAPGAKPMMQGTAGAPSMQGAHVVSTAIIPQPAQPKMMVGLSSAELIQNQQEQQRDFLTSVNELQKLKLQRDIAETNQAIAAANLATETANNSIHNMQVKPAPAPVPAGNYASSLVNPAQAGVTGASVSAAEADNSPAPYVVISVSMQMNRWTAVLGNQGKLYNVSIGDVLPVDGWIVSRISKEGVILKKDTQTRKVSLVPVI